MLERSTLFGQSKEKGDQVCVMGVFKHGGAHFQKNCNARKNTGKQSSGKGKQSQSWSKSEPSFSGKSKSKENKGKKVPKAYTRAKHRKLVSQVLKTRNRRQAQTFRNLRRHSPLTLPGTMVGMVTNGMMTGVFDEWNDDWSSVGWHEGWEQTYDTCASSFSLESFDFSAQSSPKRFELVKVNLDTGAAVNTSH